MPAIIAWLLVAAFLAMLALVVAAVVRLDRHLGQLYRWAEEKDPEAFGIWPNLAPEPPAVLDCEERGGFHVAGEGKTCQNCPAVLV
jgi:hypothetical protein